MTVISFPKKKVVKKLTPVETIDRIVDEAFSFIVDRMVIEGLLDPQSVTQKDAVVNSLGWAMSMTRSSLYNHINETHTMDAFFALMQIQFEKLKSEQLKEGGDC